MTTKDALQWAENELEINSTARLDSEILLAFALRKNRTWLSAHNQEKLSTQAVAKFKQLIAKRKQNEPIAYITGQANFFGREFMVNKDVLIPRPETERLVEIVLERIKKNASKKLVIADVGTGCGAVAITLAKELEKFGNFKILASDVSKEIITVAKANAQKNNASVEFSVGSLLEPYFEKIDIIVANLPYVPAGLLTHLSPDIKYFEPDIALSGGDSGTELIEQMLIQSKAKLANNGLIFLEMWHEHGLPLTEFINKNFPGRKVEVLKDLAGFDRYLLIS